MLYLPQQPTLINQEKALVGFWPLNDRVNLLGIARDMSGHGNNGTLVGNTVSGKSERGPIMVFDGELDYITLPFPGSIPSAEPLTLSGWLKSTQATTGTVISISDFSSADHYFQLGLNGSTNTRMAVRRGTFLAAEGPAVNDGTWHHLAGTVFNGLATLNTVPAR